MRPLPRRWTLWAVGGVVALGVAGSFGFLGPDGPWLGIVAAFAAAGTIRRHRWPSEPPTRLRSQEVPHGPDEKAVMVEFRHDGALLGWDVGILWFEKGGFGFVGRTVSFVLPRAMLAPAPPLPALQTLLRAPQLSARVFETTVGIVPLAPEFRAEMTLARIEALPDAITSETILPPSSMHPELLQRGLAVRRRFPALCLILFVGLSCLYLPAGLGMPMPSPLFGLVRGGTMLILVVFSALGIVPLPRSVRERLPKSPRKDRGR